MYNGYEEREKILEMIKNSSQDEMKFTKNENFFRAIDFALDELNELENEFNKFIQSVEHLEVYQEMVKEPLVKDTTRMIQNLKYLIEKNYTKEDQASMPSEVLQQVKATQDRRIKLLQNVAKKYFHR